ncbi:MAG: amino acid permease [Chitinophagaceae bacterium]|nr:amino acid permease [Chitinophagaceae bacterium]
MQEPNSPRYVLGYTSAVSLIVGSIIGSGIFMKPSAIAGYTGKPFWFLFVWLIAGFFSFLGAYLFAGLGRLMPETGGLYVYFKKLFGKFAGYLYGWAAFSVINTASVAAMAYVCAVYLSYFLPFQGFESHLISKYSFQIPYLGTLYPLKDAGVKCWAIALVFLLTVLNVFSLKGGDTFQKVSTALKILLFSGLIAGILTSGKGDVSHFFDNAISANQPVMLSGIVAAITGAFFAFDGWINITSVAGEVKFPEKIIPRSLITGILLCVVIYVLVNLAYLYVLPIHKIASSELLASDAMQVAFGKVAESVTAAMIFLCTLGAVNGNLMATARITYAMGKDGLFFPQSGVLHNRYGTPATALWLHACWISVFILTGTFDMLADMFVFVTWLAYAAGALGIFVVLKKSKESGKPLHLRKLKIAAAFFIIFSLFYLILTLATDVKHFLTGRQPVIYSLLALFITIAGIPLFYGFRYLNKKSGK